MRKEERKEKRVYRPRVWGGGQGGAWIPAEKARMLA